MLSEGDLFVHAPNARGQPEKEDYVLGLVGPTNSHRDLLGGTEIYWVEADWIDGVAQVQDLGFSGSGKFEDLKKIPTTRKFKAKVGRAEGGHVTLGAGGGRAGGEQDAGAGGGGAGRDAAAAKQELQQRRARRSPGCGERRIGERGRGRPCIVYWAGDLLKSCSTPHNTPPV